MYPHVQPNTAVYSCLNPIYLTSQVVVISISSTYLFVLSILDKQRANISFFENYYVEFHNMILYLIFLFILQFFQHFLLTLSTTIQSQQPICNSFWCHPYQHPPNTGGVCICDRTQQHLYPYPAVVMLLSNSCGSTQLGLVMILLCFFTLALLLYIASYTAELLIFLLCWSLIHSCVRCDWLQYILLCKSRRNTAECSFNPAVLVLNTQLCVVLAPIQ